MFKGRIGIVTTISTAFTGETCVFAFGDGGEGSSRFALAESLREHEVQRFLGYLYKAQRINRESQTGTGRKYPPQVYTLGA